MFVFGCLLTILLTIPSCASYPLCIDSCQFEHDMRTPFDLPSRCNSSRREAHCSVVLTFDATKQTVAFDFGTSSPPDHGDVVYETENILHTEIHLDDTLSVEQKLEYYCSTGDRCELDFITTKVIPSYATKRCQHLQTKLIQYLHPNSTSSHRECFLNETEIGACSSLCSLLHVHADYIKRSCDDHARHLFETSAGRSTPSNHPDYEHRLFSYGCTSQLCNGPVIQKHIQTMIDTDNGECLLGLDPPASSTTAPMTSTSTTPPMASTSTMNPNQASSLSASLLFTILILSVCFSMILA